LFHFLLHGPLPPPDKLKLSIPTTSWAGLKVDTYVFTSMYDIISTLEIGDTTLHRLYTWHYQATGSVRYPALGCMVLSVPLIALFNFLV